MRSRCRHDIQRSDGGTLSREGADFMSREPLRIMVDTNVWVDSYCPDHSESDASRAFLTESMKEEAQLFFPVHIAKDVLYIIRHELKRAILSETGSIDGETSRAIAQISLAFKPCLRKEHDGERDAGRSRRLRSVACGEVLVVAWRLRRQPCVGSLQAHRCGLLGHKRSQAA